MKKKDYYRTIVHGTILDAMLGRPYRLRMDHSFSFVPPEIHSHMGRLDMDFHDLNHIQGSFVPFPKQYVHLFGYWTITTSPGNDRAVFVVADD